MNQKTKHSSSQISENSRANNNRRNFDQIVLKQNTNQNSVKT
jgi:hypothetical protein